LFLFPFVSRGRFNDLKAQCDELKAERKVLLDRLAELGLGGALFAKPEPLPKSPQPAVEVEEPGPVRASVPMTRRPSQVMAQQTRKAFSKFHARRNVGQEEREIVLRQFDQVDAEVLQSQNGSKVG
jgi:hypothetical protein